MGECGKGLWTPPTPSPCGARGWGPERPAPPACQPLHWGLKNSTSAHKPPPDQIAQNLARTGLCEGPLRILLEGPLQTQGMGGIPARPPIRAAPVAGSTPASHTAHFGGTGPKSASRVVRRPSLQMHERLTC